MISDDFMELSAHETEPPLPEHLVDRLTRALKDKDGLGIDLYKTVARTPFKEPIENLREMAGWLGLVDKDQFLKICLTTNFINPDHYIDAVADTFGLPRVDESVRIKFRELIRDEKDGLLGYTDAEPNLSRLQKHYKLSLITNSWPFPVSLFLVESKLGYLFAPPNGDVVMSSKVIFSKQDGPEIYKIAAVRLGLEPQRMCMIGDNPVLDALSALKAGYTAILMDRYREYIDDNGDWKKDELKNTHPFLVADYPELFKIEMPVIRNFRQLPDPNR
jgi:FMN phosphatase YigB (HAD superfamily)